MSAEPIPPRAVKPRKPHKSHLPIVAVSQEDDCFLVESTGEVHSLSELPRLLVAHPESLIVTSNAAKLLYHLDLQFAPGSDLWQFRVSPDKRDVRLPNGARGRRIQATVVHFFGWKSPDKGKKGHYHYPLDSVMFARKSIHELIPGDLPRVVKLLRWGKDVRKFCEENELRVSPTSGGLAGQLLRDSRFFPEARRKIPRATNARARPHLPGNYYRLMVDEGKTFQATYLDMKSAHHTIASELSFPDPDSLYARGRFRVTDNTDVTVSDNQPWLTIGTHGYDRTIAHARGLLYVHLTVPHLKPTQFAPPFMETPGRHMTWIYTNELPMIRELGGVVDWITAGWVSFKSAPGLNRYALWSIEQLDQANADRKAWLKPTLLASYGILAARPRPMEFGFRQANSGVPREYPAGSGMLKTVAMIGDREQEMPTVNVIYRGMIEAEQRMRSLALARDLYSRGVNVLAIYADSVFVESGKPLPFLPRPWVIQNELDRLRFYSSTSFTSAQLTKLPGIPREGLERLRVLEQLGHTSVRGS